MPFHQDHKYGTKNEKVYKYDGDKMTEADGKVLEYDDIGNLVRYGDKVYTWTAGRLLKSVTDGEHTTTFTYDENGNRTSKTTDGLTTTYNFDSNGRILSQSNRRHTTLYQYDGNGDPMGAVIDGCYYDLICDQFGSVMYMSEGDTVVSEYAYDDWGSCANMDYEEEFGDDEEEQYYYLSPLNSLTYRGYYYDYDTGLYYCQSRYYSPELGRFINADIPEIAQQAKDEYDGLNLYAYCNNDPINNEDPTGYYALSESSIINFFC